MPELLITSSPVVAFLLGALHILEPAHGRSIIHALLVGSQGSKTDVWKFGVSVVLSHLGLATVLALAAWYAGDKMGSVLAPTFKVIGASLTISIGLFMTKCGLGRHTTCIHKHHGVEGIEDPEHAEKHAAHMLQAHVINPTVLGVTGGLIPCQGTIALITYSMGAGSLKAAIWLMLAFAGGLGSCLIAVGLITVAGKGRAESLSRRLGGSTALALAPGIVVALMGVIALMFSLAEFGHPEIH